MSDKPNCYECKFRGMAPGSVHSSCKHPVNKEISNDPILGMISIFASVGRAVPINVETGLNVVGNPTGIKKGWFNWPFNFDPVWLESCNGFEEKDDSSVSG